ncbi:hypothetical protein IC582_029223 [Cucumis melo]
MFKEINGWIGLADGLCLIVLCIYIYIHFFYFTFILVVNFVLFDNNLF